MRFILNFNDLGGTSGSPLTPTLDKKWNKVGKEAKGWFATRTGAYKFGAIMETAVQSDIWVIHMVCQNKDLSVSTEGLAACLRNVVKLAKEEKASVHISNILLDAAPALEVLLVTELVDKGIRVVVYEEPGFKVKVKDEMVMIKGSEDKSEVTEKEVKKALPKVKKNSFRRST
jgi:hypothetical protein